MRIKQRKLIRGLAVVLPLLITLILWLLSKPYNSDFYFSQQLPVYLSQILSLWGTVLLAIVYFLATRSFMVERLYGGMDKVYKLHNRLSRIAFVFILAHPLLLLVGFPSLEAAIRFLTPAFSIAGFTRTSGVLALYLYIILIVITIVRFLPYEVWKKTHKLMGVPFILAAYHVVTISSDVQNYLPLMVWMIFWLALGIGSYLYKLLFYKFIGPRYQYEVVDKYKRGDIGEIVLRPLGKKMNYEPGEFIFFSVKDNENISSEEHPFSVASTPGSDRIKLFYKEVGDYTRSLTNIQQGDKVEVYGPYGEFTSYIYNPYKKQVWIGGGIGITPFLSMLNYEAQNEDSKNIFMYYLTGEEQEAVYTDEIRGLISGCDDKIFFKNKISSKDGRITADEIIKDAGSLKEAVILLCGPMNMMKSLKEQFTKLGIPAHRIIFEDFDLL